MRQKKLLKSSETREFNGYNGVMGNITGIFSAVPLDWFIIGGILILVAFDSLRSGIGRAAAFAVALPLALTLAGFAAKAVPLASVSILSSKSGAAGLFAILIILAYFLVRRMGLEFLDGGMGQPIQAILAGAALAVICAIVWLEADALNAYWQFGPQVQSLFSEGFRLWWLLGAYAALAFARG